MERMVDKGLTKSIGISNFNKRQIQRILNNCRIKPVTNQIEHHIYLQQNNLINFCKKHNILVTAYSPLGSTGLSEYVQDFGIEKVTPDLINNETVKRIAERLNKTPAQILLRFIVQRGIATIPKSTNTERLRQNIELFDFELTVNDIQDLKTLDRNIRILNFEFIIGYVKCGSYLCRFI